MTSGTSLVRSPSSHQLLHFRNRVGTVVPGGLDQLFEGGILCIFQCSDFDVAGSLADALEQVVWIVELPAVKESESYSLL